MIEKSAITDYPIHSLLRERWSPRAFDLSDVPEEQVLSLFEAARWSPSSNNRQPWSFIAIQRSDTEAFANAICCLNEGNLIWAQQVPLLLLTVAQLKRDDGALNRTALYDLGQSVAHLTVQAADLGLWARQIGGFSQDRARELFAIPEDYEPVTFIALGKRGDISRLPEHLQEREQAPRVRKPLADFVFGRVWGQPSALVGLKAKEASA